MNINCGYEYNLRGKKMQVINQKKLVNSGKSRFAVAGITALALFLQGCAVNPVPLTEQELTEAAADKLARIDLDQEAVAAPIGLYEAMARALKYNLDHKVELMQMSLARAKLTNANYEGLPSIMANAGYSARNKDSASYSENLLTGLRSSSPSFSSDRSNLASDLTFTWNILDFGLSYVRAKQTADKALIAEEQKRKVVNRIVEDVRTSYWRAISAEHLLTGFQSLEARVIKAQKNSKALRKAGQTSPLAALTFERELIDIKKQIQRLERELTTAKIQLAALMNIRPGTSFKLVVPDRNMLDLSLKIDGESMVDLALKNRPELRENIYSARINAKEADAALLKMLPGASVYGSLNLDTNDFLYNSNWATWGAKASWNAIQLLKYPAMKSEIDAQSSLIDQQSLALTMAIITQVHVARARYAYLHKSAGTAAEFYNVQRSILKQVKASAAAEASSEQVLLREEMNTLVAAVEFDIAYSDLQNAFATVYTSVGLDPYDASISTDMSVSELATSLRSTWRERGDLDG
ncbi:MAG: TolC family protein [Rhizobiaceae bacterium]